MIAVRLLRHDEIAERLSRFGCTHIETIVDPQDDYYADSYWRTSWGHSFIVPLIGTDRACPEHRLYAILAELGKLAPDNGE